YCSFNTSDHDLRGVPLMKTAFARKNLVYLAMLVATFAFIFLGGFVDASANDRDSPPTYTLDEVIDACEGAYSNGQQIDQCIMNVCGRYGCEDW
ncbi:MAG: hypothetical protein AAGD01_20800, partial [Acidobacteriota bacterium]